MQKNQNKKELQKMQKCLLRGSTKVNRMDEKAIHIGQLLTQFVTLMKRCAGQR